MKENTQVQNMVPGGGLLITKPNYFSCVKINR